jgi:hypothetical protein
VFLFVLAIPFACIGATSYWICPTNGGLASETSNWSSGIPTNPSDTYVWGTSLGSNKSCVIDLNITAASLIVTNPFTATNTVTASSVTLSNTSGSYAFQSYSGLMRFSNSTVWVQRGNYNAAGYPSPSVSFGPTGIIVFTNNPNATLTSDAYLYGAIGNRLQTVLIGGIGITNWIAAPHYIYLAPNGYIGTYGGLLYFTAAVDIDDSAYPIRAITNTTTLLGPGGLWSYRTAKYPVLYLESTNGIAQYPGSSFGYNATNYNPTIVITNGTVVKFYGSSSLGIYGTNTTMYIPPGGALIANVTPLYITSGSRLIATNAGIWVGPINGTGFYLYSGSTGLFNNGSINISGSAVAIGISAGTAIASNATLNVFPTTFWSVTQVINWLGGTVVVSNAEKQSFTAAWATDTLRFDAGTLNLNGWSLTCSNFIQNGGTLLRSNSTVYCYSAVRNSGTCNVAFDTFNFLGNGVSSNLNYHNLTRTAGVTTFQTAPTISNVWLSVGTAASRVGWAGMNTNIINNVMRATLFFTDLYNLRATNASVEVWDGVITNCAGKIYEFPMPGE